MYLFVCSLVIGFFLPSAEFHFRTLQLKLKRQQTNVFFCWIVEKLAHTIKYNPNTMVVSILLEAKKKNGPKIK